MTDDPALGRLTESRTHPEWGAKPAPPVCGAGWLRRFAVHPARLSSGIETDREWYAAHFTACLIKGFCRADVIRDALAGEGTHPVLAECDGKPYAMATLWLNLIRDSVCGSYHEVVLSFDVNHTRPDAVAFRTTTRRAPWALLYPTFGKSACDAQFLHSLWINSPLSIMWGREMQGFPKHPKPVESTITDDAERFAFDLRWDGAVVMRGHAGKRFGVGGFVRESWGLVRNQRLFGVSRFLLSKSFAVPVLMPAKTAAQNGVGRRYLAHLWKGLHPAAVRVWPWGDGDELELGDMTISTGCEDHNGQRLLRAAEFRPVAVTYLPRAAAIVESAG